LKVNFFLPHPETIELGAEGKLSFLAEVREVLESISVALSSAYFSHTALQARENF
jgi:hypothetical protein